MIENQIFKKKTIDKKFNYKIACGTFYNGFLYLGDQKGNAYKYPLDSQKKIPKSVSDQQNPINNKKLQSIRCYQHTQTVIIQSDQKIYHYELNLKKKIGETIQKIQIFALKQSLQNFIPAMICVNKKKQGLIYEFKNKMMILKQKKFSLLQIPQYMQFSRNILVVAYKKEYNIIDIENKFITKKVQLPFKFPMFKIVSQQEILFFAQNLGIFMGYDGMPKQRNPVTIPVKQILEVIILEFYLIILFDSHIHIYNCCQNFQLVETKNSQLIQQISIVNGKNLSRQGNSLYCITKEDIIVLQETQYEEQIKICLMKCKLEEALNILNHHEGEGNGKGIKLRIDALWNMLKNLKFEKAKQLFKQIDIDLRELICLFPNLVSKQKQKYLKDSKNFDKYIMQAVQKNLKLGEQKDKIYKQEKKKIRLLLKQVLEQKRKILLMKYRNNLKQTFFIQKSQYSLCNIKFNPLSIAQYLQFIDFALLKLLIQMSPMKIEQFFINNPKIYCQLDFQQFFYIFVSNKNQTNPKILPRFYALFGRYQQALRQWKKFSQSQIEETIQEACIQAAKIIVKSQSQQHIYNHLPWILDKNFNIGMSIFQQMSQKTINPDVILNFLNQCNKKKNQQFGKKYQQKYLQILIFKRNIQDERFHTKLMLSYLQDILRLKKQENDPSLKKLFDQKFKKMNEFLKNKNARYNSYTILQKIKESFLFDQQIFLYSKQNKHQDAINKLVRSSKLEQAQHYCLTNKHKTLTLLFQKLIKQFKMLTEQKQKSQDIVKFKEYICKFLKKYASNQQLDPLVVMENIPDDWILQQSGQNNGLYWYLFNAISNSLHKTRSVNTSRHLSQMQLLNFESKLVKAKQASVKITPDKKCSKCLRPIQQKVFVVFPNGIICHQSCIKGYSICPVTGQDFQRTYKQ